MYMGMLTSNKIKSNWMTNCLNFIHILSEKQKTVEQRVEKENVIHKFVNLNKKKKFLDPYLWYNQILHERRRKKKWQESCFTIFPGGIWNTVTYCFTVRLVFCEENLTRVNRIDDKTNWIIFPFFNYICTSSTSQFYSYQT